VDGQVPELREDHQPEGEAEGADDEPGEQQRVAVDAQELDRREVGQQQVGLAAGAVAGLRAAAGAGALRVLRQHLRPQRGEREDRAQRAEQPLRERRR
jgi:hypothetical protein